MGALLAMFQQKPLSIESPLKATHSAAVALIRKDEKNGGRCWMHVGRFNNSGLEHAARPDSRVLSSIRSR